MTPKYCGVMSSIILLSNALRRYEYSTMRFFAHFVLVHMNEFVIFSVIIMECSGMRTSTWYQYQKFVMLCMSTVLSGAALKMIGTTTSNISVSISVPGTGTRKKQYSEYTS